MADISKKNAELFVLLQGILMQTILVIGTVTSLIRNDDGTVRRKQKKPKYSMADRIPKQIEYVRELVELSDVKCINQLGMNRKALVSLVYLLENVGGLKDTRYTSVRDKTAMFLLVLSHNTKNRVIQQNFKKSGHTVSKHFHAVLNAVLKLQRVLMVPPQPISDDNTDPNWKWFKGCLGALDGTHVNVTVPDTDKARYRNRKGEVSVNVLGACDPNLKFTYILAGWEGSTDDSHVLLDALSRPHGLKVPKGNYYLCDNVYTNVEGFLAPYERVRYNLDGWDVDRNPPQNPREHFNMIHSKARNVIQRSFGLLKKRWAILRSSSSFPIKIQNRIIMACCLLQNFIRSEMPYDPVEDMDEQFDDGDDELDENEDDGDVNDVEDSDEWSNWRDALATTSFNEWRNVR